MESSRILLEKLVEHSFHIVRVYAYAPRKIELTSGYVDLSEYCETQGVAYRKFQKINDHADGITEDKLDVLFVVGLSQMVSPEITEAPSLGCVGFHPTALPRGRGRAPLGWLTAKQEDGAATFFEISEMADAGGIFVQEPFSVSEDDNAKTVYDKLLVAMKTALDRWLPQLKTGQWKPVVQDEAAATEYGIRKPEDGLIGWERPANQIYRLIQAAANPHPGAFTFFGLDRLIVLAARRELELPITGIPGRVLKVRGEELLLQTGNGLLWLTEYVGNSKKIRVGDRLGYLPELEIYNMKREISDLRKMIEAHHD
ncbi:methionyl-tRNA formyltransferase [Deinococcus marmoris]|uniref:methionyl-tRNA formyltransferase n=1 Tax=Deinococcus marmoris TaxID=249408 RepID=UPI00138E374A|nr:formyltransferase family protein [Deinococcus marmoris]